MVGHIISLASIGLLAGVVAPFCVPGRRNMPIVVTVVLGILGSFGGGVLAYLMFGRDAVDSNVVDLVWVIGSVVGAVTALVLFIAFGRRPTVSAQLDVRGSWWRAGSEGPHRREEER
jgi:uncharacterized membrane protein YeaQ/YmgE (transglycosylase-associated protein family)